MSVLGELLRSKRRAYRNAQGKLFVASGVLQFAYVLTPASYEYSEWWDWVIPGVIALVAYRPIIDGLAELSRYYRNTGSWSAAQNPTSEKNTKGGFSSFNERRAAGMYDGRGRTLGLDEHGYLLFLPWRLRPNFTLVIGGQGSGKTSTGAIPSSILSVLWHRPGTERRK
ncbi:MULTISPECIES: hypothetical protein [Alphaproteobacteria]|uniref:hypothetical protein n=1 Tax=Alphaproteobacteria TaxID=28211 RepID=UPI00329682DF